MTITGGKEAVAALEGGARAMMRVTGQGSLDITLGERADDTSQVGGLHLSVREGAPG
jgi:hypothetical protein